MVTETRLVSGKKSDILVEGASASVKHGTPLVSPSFPPNLEEPRQLDYSSRSEFPRQSPFSKPLLSHGSPLQSGRCREQLLLVEQRPLR